jgi:hypothetical protein
MWKFGLRASNSFSGNICFEFSVLCLFAVQGPHAWATVENLELSVATAGDDGVAAFIFKGDLFTSIQNCFICRLLESTMSEEAGIGGGWD